MYRVMLCVLLWASNAAAQDSTLQCNDDNTTVSHHYNLTDALAVCAAVRDTNTFMRSHGFDVDIPITVTVVEAAVEPHNARVIAKYDATTSAISISAFNHCCQMFRSDCIFGEKMSRELYRSFIAHEVAHAIAQNNFRIPHPSVAAHEYIAYLVQLATMEQALRNRILGRFNHEPFTGDQEISELFFALGPEIFAIKSYRHFAKSGNGDAFIQRLLNGHFRSPARH